MSEDTTGNRIPLPAGLPLTEAEMGERARAFRDEMSRRRSVRHFSTRPVPGAVIEACIATAASAPSGANMQPWHFVAVSDSSVKQRIREAAERVEHAFYEGLAGEAWLADLEPLGTDAQKPLLTDAPYVIAVFAQPYGLQADGSKRKHYYVEASVGIATGMLLTALHHAGLATLTYTPARMGFLRDLLGRPGNERAYLLVVAGHPAEGATVPDLKRKRFSEVATFVE